MNQQGKSPRNRMRRIVAPRRSGGDGTYSFSLYSADGGRKYLNREEFRRFLAVLPELEADERLFALMLALTGARISEALSVMPASFQIEAGIVAFRTLKRRGTSWREVPLPRWFMAELDEYFGLAAAQKNAVLSRRHLWPQHRVTGWRTIKHAFAIGEIIGRAASPRGLRHSFGVGTLQEGVPLDMVQRWLGHARISTTSIYTAVCGPEERALAQRWWGAFEAFKGGSASAQPIAENDNRATPGHA